MFQCRILLNIYTFSSFSAKICDFAYFGEGKIHLFSSFPFSFNFWKANLQSEGDRHREFPSVGSLLKWLLRVWLNHIKIRFLKLPLCVSHDDGRVQIRGKFSADFPGILAIRWVGSEAYRILNSTHIEFQCSTLSCCATTLGPNKSHFWWLFNSSHQQFWIPSRNICSESTMK